MATAWPVLFVLAIIVALMTASFLFVPKGPHQTYVIGCDAASKRLRMLTCAWDQVNTDSFNVDICSMLSNVDGNIHGPITPLNVSVEIHQNGATYH